MPRRYPKDTSDFIRSNYSILGAQKIANQLHTTPDAIRYWAYKRGIKYYHKMPEPLKLSEAQSAYIAGIIDGEGYVTLNSRIARGRLRLAPRIIIVNTNSEMIDWIHQLIPSNFKLERKQLKLCHKIAYALEITGLSRVLALTQAILPYSIIKKRQLTLLLEFCESRFSKPYNSPYSESEKSIKQKILKLNSGGVID